MKKKDYESLGALQKMIYDFLSESFKKGVIEAANKEAAK